MKITQALKAELAHWLDTFWKTYIKGDYDLWATFVADDYYNIGGTKEEIWHSKQEILEYSYAMQDQMVGQAEIRNREIEVQHFGDYLMVNEFTDLFVRIEGEWTFYGPFRMSSLLAKTATGWIALHQHGSYPDMKATKGEAFASDALKAENKRLLEAVDLRTTELLGKNRELAIEAALEKVRAVAMGMKTPDDMLKVCRIIEGQLEVLGIQQIRNVQTAIIEPKEEIYRCYQYFPGYDQDVIERTEYPKNPVEQQMVDQMLATRDSHFLGKLSGEELTEFRMHRKQENHLADPLLEEVEDLGYCFLSIGEGGLGLTLYRSLDEESLSLFKRFHQVFSLTYQRFRDIQKAEAQGRETEIELALERVRARTMAMHNSSELAEASILLDQQVRSLGIQTWGCAFHIYADNEEGDYEWFSSANGSLPFYKTPREKFFLDFYERGQRGEKFHVKEFAGEECKAHYEFLKTIPIAGDSLKALEESGISLPTYQIDHIAFFKHGYVLFITYEPVPEAYEIFQRFAKVFEQTYTRFLDLEKAETQAREAQIETALERVRSRSLAMHATSDLQEVIHAVHQELIKLDIGIFGGSFIVINSEIEKEIHCWGAGGTADTSDEVHIPYFDKPFYTNLVKGLKSGPSFFTEEFTQEEKKEFFTFLFTKEPWSNLKANEKKEILSSPGGYTRSCSVSLHTSIFIINQLGNKFSEKENDILKRFGKVFEQSYTRFLDLQKAEAQAREAQIEVAIERVRAQSMAMHHPDDLDKVNKEILAQLNWLQIEGLTGVTFYLIDEKGWVKAWDFSNPGNTGDQSSYTLQFDSNKHEMLGFPFKTLRQSDLDYFVADYPREKLEKAVYEFEEIDPAIAKIVREALSTGILTHQWTACCRISNGLLGIDLVNPPKKDTEAIVLKMAGAFNQAYTRFLDLQKAEAQAREGQIEAALERVRSRSLAMHHSSELSSVVDTLLQEFTGLDFTLTFCIINLIDEDDLSNTVWAANPETGKDAESYYMKFEDYDFHRAMWDAWKAQDKRFVYVLEGEEKKIYDEYLYSETEFRRFPKHVQEANKSLERYVAGFTFFKYSGLQTVSVNPISEEELAILERFGKVFEQAYIRFLDLQKAEAQVREAKIEASLERVRSRSMAMHKTDELQEVVRVVAEELKNTGVILDTWGAVICTYFQDSKDVLHWTASENPDSPSIAFLLPYFKDELYDEAWASKNRGDSYFAKVFSFDVKNAFFKHAFEHSDYRQLPDDYKKLILESESHGIAWAWSKNSAIMIPSIQGDLPSEGEKEILIRFVKVFEQAYIRFLDLQKAEAQTRESQIQLALERVRARTMAMQHSDELQDAAILLFQQVKALGVQTGSCGFNIWNKNEKTATVWMSSAEGGLQSPFILPHTESTIYKQVYQARKNDELFLVKKVDGIILKKHFDYLLTLPGIGEVIKKLREASYAFPETMVYHFAFFSQGYLSFHLHEHHPETHDIFKRFAKVFEQTYTRFLDLQKAEAQARKARIEAALERTRTQSMLMKHSDEIKSISTIFHQQLLELDIPSEFSYVWLPDEPNSEHQFWASWSEEENGKAIYQSKQVTYPLDKSEPYTKACFEAWVQPEVLLEEFISPPEVAGFFEVWQELLEGAEKLKAEYFPEGIFYSEAYMRFGCFGINIRRRLTPEEKSILKRFSIEFERAYTRFLDLKKAEEQAREAQIELAVERVRARALAMYQSGEILEVVHKLKEEIMNLNIPQVAAATIHLKEPDGRCRVWDLTSLELKEEDLHLPLDISFKLDDTHPDFFMRKIWVHTEDYFVVIQKKRDFPHTVQWLKENGHPEQAEEARIFFDTTQLEQAYHPTVPLKNGRMSLDLLEPPQDEVASILKKMAAAFDLAYKRFEDLQKAESQAKEAKIELSLERIRSQVTSMQESNELFDVVVAMRKEFVSLGHQAHSFWHMKWSSESYDMSMTSEEGDRIGMIISVPKFVHDNIPSLASWEKSDSPVFVLDLDGSQAWDYIENMNKYGHYELADPKSPSEEDILALGGLTFVIARTTHGEIGFSLPGKIPNPPEESLHTLIRFAKVFGIAYKRFEDLQYAEAQAKEAQIELSLERIRSKVTSMQESTDLLDIMVSIRSEFVSLGHEAQYFWYMRWLPSKYEKAMTSGDGAQVGMVMSLPRHIHGDIPLVANWERGNEPTLIFPMDVDTAMDYVQKMVSLGDFEKVDPNAPTMDDIKHIGGLTFIMAKTSQGEIGYSLPGYVPNPPEEAVSTLARFAGVFDLAYKRFEDLKKAEKDLVAIKAAKSKAESALKELKAAQEQLVQQEKLASLGQLTAGIAHEIKNPLNFVNNFSELSKELIEEVFEELEKLDPSDIKQDIFELLTDVQSNLTKVHEHGSRADGIVKSMLQHSRGSAGKTSAIRVNEFVKEFSNLAFHGMRAGKNPININLDFDLDENAGEVTLVMEDFSRVILNIANNAFDAMRDKLNSSKNGDYLPCLKIKTKRLKNKVLISIQDNGPGIPKEIKDKILQPFFTTKKGTEGTGLGLSITHDIVKAHRGEIKIESKPGDGASFLISLPIS